MKFSRFSPRGESTGLLFWQASTLWQRRIRAALEPFDLTHTQFVILAVVEELSEHEECISQKMIADFSLIDAMTVSSTVRLLESKKLLRRQTHKTDTRAKSLRNTEKGLAALCHAVPAVEAVDTSFFFTSAWAKERFHQLLESLLETSLNPQAAEQQRE